MMAQKPKPENNSAAYFEPGSAVEVRTHGGLFRGSWFSGTIISRDASDRFLQVEYHNHHNVREFVSLHQLRPLLPPETRHRKFESGEKVVLFFNGGWCEGHVIKDLGNRMFNVRLRDSKKKMVFPKKLIRPPRQWFNNIWVLQSQITRYFRSSLFCFLPVNMASFTFSSPEWIYFYFLI